jgi:hypothetical protein
MIRPERLLIPDWLSSVNKNTIPPDHFAASPPANVKHCFSHVGREAKHSAASMASSNAPPSTERLRKSACRPPQTRKVRKQSRTIRKESTPALVPAASFEGRTVMARKRLSSRPQQRRFGPRAERLNAFGVRLPAFRLLPASAGERMNRFASGGDRPRQRLVSQSHSHRVCRRPRVRGSARSSSLCQGQHPRCRSTAYGLCSTPRLRPRVGCVR